jgi:prophage DNA circulation protein
MTEENDKYYAYIYPQWKLEIEDINDDFEKSIAEHEFPYRDGALLEDMGQKARKIRFRCYFYNENYESHIELIKFLEGKDLVEMAHPQYGIIFGKIATLSVRHNERKRTAEIDITFIENLRGEIYPLTYVDVESAAEEAFIQGQDEQIEEFKDDAKEELGAEADEVLEKELDPDKGILEQFTDISAKARKYVKDVDTYVRMLEGTLNKISNPANSLTSTIKYGVNLPGRVIGAVAKTVERYAILYNTLRTAPSRFLLSLKDGLKKLELSFGKFSKHTRIASVQRRALEAGYIYKADESKRQALKSAEKVKSFDATGHYLKTESLEQIMTIQEIEQTLADVRSDIQETVEISRGMQSLKDLARDILEHVNKIKLEREKLVRVDIENEIPLHLICLKYGLSYNYATRIHAINNCKHPNFVSGEISIYAR